MLHHPGISLERRLNALLRSFILFLGQLKPGRHRHPAWYSAKVISDYRRHLQSIATLLSGVSLTVGALAQENPDPNNLTGPGKEPVGKFIQPVAPPALDLLKTIDLHIDYSWVPQSNVSSSAAYRKATEQTLQIDATARLKVNDRLTWQTRLNT